MASKKSTVIGHLKELRSRLFKSVIFLFIAFVVCYMFADKIYSFLLDPYVQATKNDVTQRRMIFTGLHETFLTYLKYLKGDKKAFFTDDQIKGFLQFVIFASIIIIIYSYFFVKESIPHNIRESVFNVVSIITGTGFTTEDFGNWGNFSMFFFLILMFVGGCTASTTCGIKIFRFQIVNLFISKQIKQIIYPNGVFPIKYKNQIINEGILTSVLTFVFLYIFIYFILSALLSMTGLDFVTSVSAAATALSNVGPGLGDVIGPNGNFKSLPDLSKWYLSFAMLLGRLELFSVLVFFLPSFWRD